MIATATEKAKFKRFVRKVRPFAGGEIVDPKTIAVGILERLWQTTAKDAPRGDIGKLEDDEIADECGWFGDPATLIEMLVVTGWLDRHPIHRLTVHDWHEHAPKYVKGVVARQGGFVTEDQGSSTNGQRPMVSDHKSGTNGTPPPNLTKPILKKTSPDGEAVSIETGENLCKTIKAWHTREIFGTTTPPAKIERMIRTTIAKHGAETVGAIFHRVANQDDAHPIRFWREVKKLKAVPT